MAERTAGPSTTLPWISFGPPKVMKSRLCSATTLKGSAALPFVISTGAKRSGGTCGSFGQYAHTLRRPTTIGATGGKPYVPVSR